MIHIQKLASAILNDIVSGLQGYHQNLSLSIELLQDEIVLMRLAILKEYFLKGVLPIKDFLVAINCIDVDCKDLERCPCSKDSCKDLMAHIEIPLIITDFGKQAIDYIGSTDRMHPFMIIQSLTELRNRKYRRFGKDKPYVWIDQTPNSNGMLDCFIFNAPLLKQVTVIGAWKDPRLIGRYPKYSGVERDTMTGADDNMSFIDMLVKEKLTNDKIKYYRQLAAPVQPNDQEYTTGS